MNETSNAIVELTLPLESLEAGGKHEVTLARRAPCDACKGTGRREGTPACDECKGSGRIPRVMEGSNPPITIQASCPSCEGLGHSAKDTCPTCERGYTKTDVKLSVDVPAKSRPGEQLRLSGEGHTRPDATRSDVIVVLAAEPMKATPPQSSPLSKVAFLVLAALVLILAYALSR